MNKTQQSASLNSLIDGIAVGIVKKTFGITEQDEREYIEAKGKEVKTGFADSIKKFFDMSPAHIVLILANLESILKDESQETENHLSAILEQYSNEQAMFFERDCMMLFLGDDFRKHFACIEKSNDRLVVNDYIDIAQHKSATIQ